MKIMKQKKWFSRQWSFQSATQTHSTMMRTRMRTRRKRTSRRATSSQTQKSWRCILISCTKLLISWIKTKLSKICQITSKERELKLSKKTRGSLTQIKRQFWSLVQLPRRLTRPSKTKPQTTKMRLMLRPKPRQSHQLVSSLWRRFRTNQVLLKLKRALKSQK